MVGKQGAPDQDQNRSANPSPMGKVGPLNATRDHSNDGSTKPYDPQLQNSMMKSNQSHYNPTSPLQARPQDATSPKNQRDQFSPSKQSSNLPSQQTKSGLSGLARVHFSKEGGSREGDEYDDEQADGPSHA